MVIYHHLVGPRVAGPVIGQVWRGLGRLITVLGATCPAKVLSVSQSGREVPRGFRVSLASVLGGEPRGTA